MIIIDKHKSLSNKIRILAASLSKFPHEDQYVVPAVRDAIDRYAAEE
jgi:uracil phosphoribosyltransferase